MDCFFLCQILIGTSYFHIKYYLCEIIIELGAAFYPTYVFYIQISTIGKSKTKPFNAQTLQKK